MSKPLQYPVPWKIVFSIGPELAKGLRTSVDTFSAGIVAQISPQPLILGLENLPEDPRFVLVANHYQRKGLWIAHAAAIVTQAIRSKYGPGDPPVRWLVTANFPPVAGIFPSPGDWLLPRVAYTLHCYPISFAGTKPKFTARSIRQLLRDVRTINRPIGVFPEGAAGIAGKLSPPLPGVNRLLQLLRLPVVPVGISEAGRFVVRFGKPVEADIDVAMKRIAELTDGGDGSN